MTARHAPLLEAEGLTRVYGSGASATRALDGAHLRLDEGELVLLRGRSGAGKTTLVHVLAGLEQPDEGVVRYGGRPLASLAEDDLLELRRRQLGVVFQSLELLPVLSAAENVEVPLRLLSTPAAERDARVRELLERVGLGQHAAQRPPELSGGQQQRVALARALAVRPRILLADEPTGQLDSGTTTAVMAMLRELVRETGLAALVTTHDARLEEFADRVVELRDGRTLERR